MVKETQPNNDIIILYGTLYWDLLALTPTAWLYFPIEQAAVRVEGDDILVSSDKLTSPTTYNSPVRACFV